jgi:type 1 glutamine amidotransferase
MKILALGHFTNYKYHPFTDVARKLQEIVIEAGDEVDCSQVPGELTIDNLSRYDLLISYADAWDERLTPDQLSELQQFISSGKGLLAIHCGISYQNPGYFQLLGAKFTGHPPFQRLTIHIKDSNHPITAGLTDFTMEDELYMFEFVKPSTLNILMECPFEGENHPIAWTRDFGRGRVVYLAPGHLPEGFENEMYAKTLLNSIRWAGSQTIPPSYQGKGIPR